MKQTTNHICRYPGAHWIKQNGVPAVCFSVWAPKVEKVEVHLLAPDDRLVALHKDDFGYHSGIVENVSAGADYLFRLDTKLERPDPASRWQPQGVHSPSRVMDWQFGWTDVAWTGLPLRDYIVYELHVGTFSPEGTFDGVIKRLPELKELGVTAIEIMPVAQFPGSRNWGYDGVYPFAVQESYGGPAGLKRLVNAAHALGLAIVLDVVYNHLGPEGNYMNEFAPYFTDRYKTPWGWALNFDGPESDHVRHYFAENALYWQTEFHLDALRLDAVHAICDFSATPFLEELSVITHRQAETLKRPFYLIAESDMNMARHILPRTLGGYGMDAQWSDDFHHALHVLLTGEQQGYYEDFTGLAQFGKFWREGYTFTGEYSGHRRRRHGSSPQQLAARQFVICAQNHDQVGNRMLGDRLSAMLTLEQLKLAAGCVLLSPFIPMLFMGEEYGETAPFQYFVSHGDPGLVEAVRQGRSKEFAAFKWKGEVPDPQAEKTFETCRLNRDLLKQPSHQALLEFHRELIRLRKSLPAIANAEKETTEVLDDAAAQTLCVRYRHEQNEVVLWFYFGSQPKQIQVPLASGSWRALLDSAAPQWQGPGREVPETINSTGQITLELAPTSVLLLQKV
jgi:maltooligosyltrehalose trehalohydrolase